MTGATSNSQFGNFRVELFGIEIEVGLGLYVVTEDAVSVPLREMLKKVVTVGIETIRSDSSSDGLQDRKRAAGAYIVPAPSSSIAPCAAIQLSGPHWQSAFARQEKRRSSGTARQFFHPGLHAKIFESVVAHEIALHIC